MHQDKEPRKPGILAENQMGVLLCSRFAEFWVVIVNAYPYYAHRNSDDYSFPAKCPFHFGNERAPVSREDFAASNTADKGHYESGWMSASSCGNREDLSSDDSE